MGKGLPLHNILLSDNVFCTLTLKWDTRIPVETLKVIYPVKILEMPLSEGKEKTNKVVQHLV